MLLMSSQQAIPAVDLGHGVFVPAVGLGTHALRGKRGYQAMRTALELGYRHLDTATMYKNEAEVGRAVADSGLPREEVFVTTKMLASAAGRARQSLDTSLRELRLDYVDLWLIHWPPAASALVSAWQAFLEAREAGLARAVGVSNFSLAQLDEVTRATGQAPSINQVDWSPVRHDPAYLEGMRERGVVVEGYSPLKGSNLRDPVLRRIADRHQVTPAQVVLRWHLEHEIVIIPKSADAGRQAVNLDLAGFALDPAEVAQIDQLSSQP
jgi:2,5-diketo-D-gluconate reductase A